MYNFYYKTVGKGAAEEEGWTPGETWVSEDDSSFGDHFENILVVFPDLTLTRDEISRVSGCIGYALKQVVRGEQLSDPKYYSVHSDTGSFTVIQYTYDTTKTRSDDPDIQEAFRLARVYIEEGTPIRKTNAAGKDTKDTRLVRGAGITIAGAARFFTS